jgi:hypothetical protein
VLTAAQAIRARQENTRIGLEERVRQQNLARLRRQDEVANINNIAKVTGSFSTASRAARAWAAGDTDTFYEVLEQSGPTLQSRVADAQIAASRTAANASVLQAAKYDREVEKIEAQIGEIRAKTAGARLGLADKMAGIFKTIADIRKIEDELGGTPAGKPSDLVGWSSSVAEGLTDKQLSDLDNKIFKEKDGWGAALGLPGQDYELNRQQGADLDKIRIGYFDRDTAFLITKSPKGEIGTRLVPGSEVLKAFGTGFGGGASGADRDKARKRLTDWGLLKGVTRNARGQEVPTDLGNDPNKVSQRMWYDLWRIRAAGGGRKGLGTIETELRKTIEELLKEQQ